MIHRSLPLTLLVLLTTVVWGAVPPAEEWRLPVGHFEAARFPLTAIHPRPDSETPPEAYHRVAHPGMRWDCPVRAAFGAYPYHAQLVTGPAGMTIGSWLARQPDGELVEDAAYCTLTWLKPVEGTYSIAVRITDQEGKTVDVAWTLVVAPGLHYFAAPAATGKGDGSSRADQAAFSGVYGTSDKEPSPAKGKVLVLATGSYPLATSFHLVSAWGKPVSIMAYPGDMPDIVATAPGVRFLANSSDTMLTGLRLRGFRIGNAGIISTYDHVERLTVWRNAFLDCAGDPKHHNNESVWFCARTDGSVKRKHLLMSENTYSGCVDIAVFIFYAVSPLLSERDVFTTTEAKLLEPVWFPKAVCDFELRRHHFDNPQTEAPVYGVLDASNNVEHGTASGEIRYNFIRSKGGSGVFWNASATAATKQCHNYRNTCIGAAVTAKDWKTSNLVRFVADVIQNPAGGVHPESAGYTSEDTECQGKDGIVGQDGKLTGNFRDRFFGRRGWEIAGAPQQSSVR